MASCRGELGRLKIAGSETEGAWEFIGYSGKAANVSIFLT